MSTTIPLIIVLIRTLTTIKAFFMIWVRGWRWILGRLRERWEKLGGNLAGEEREGEVPHNHPSKNQ
jgi:hypothetical protein